MDDMGITMSNVCFSYEDKKILDNITLSVQTGESVGIIGTSGGGKSTLLKLISGLYDVQIGEIHVMNARTAADRRRNVAMVMQSATLFPVSIRDNITCGHPMDEADIWRALHASQLSEWIFTLPDGIDTFVGERGGKVSGGQAQRIAIARAIAKNAPVILLDEPTSALDGDTGAAVIAALAELTKGKTVLHVSHRPETLVGCGRIFCMEGGRLYAP
jgi:ATP-binding cassette subfamily B protein/subfamily B ATP-binding cassette protein MsbA